MSMLAEFTHPAWNRRVNRHPHSLLSNTCKFMTQDKRMFKGCIANRTFRKPMQIRAAYTDGFNANEFFSHPRDGNSLIMNL
jgi:hypothetical protein